jgi:hypothetical protein
MSERASHHPIQSAEFPSPQAKHIDHEALADEVEFKIPLDTPEIPP